jgi:hypothetical protein
MDTHYTSVGGYQLSHWHSRRPSLIVDGGKMMLPALQVAQRDSVHSAASHNFSGVDSRATAANVGYVKSLAR